MLILLPPAVLLPLWPANLLPVLLLPLGIVPPLIFHPNLTPTLLNLTRHPQFLKMRAFLENLALTDALDDQMGRKEVGRVEVWENERLDPSVASKTPIPSLGAPSVLPGAWSSRHLRGGERAPWIKITTTGGAKSLWKTLDEVSNGEGEKMALALEDNWAFVPGEDWRVDVCGLWSRIGTDEDGWAYSDDSWQVCLALHTEAVV